MKTSVSFSSNSSSCSFILPKKDLTLEQIRGLDSWVNIHNEIYYDSSEDHYIRETTRYYFGYVNSQCGLKEQLSSLNIIEDQYDLEG